ncbi:hypothetical protein Tco_0279046, partial [Tanacetum coccineum]
EMHDADEVHVDDEETDEEIVYAEKVDTKKTEEEKVDNEQARADQAAKDDQAGALIFVTQKENREFPPSSSSLSMSFYYGNQFVNISSDVSLSAPLLDVLVSVIPEQRIPTPILTPLTTTEAQATVICVHDPSPTLLERLLELEKKVEALSKVDHFKAIEESVHANVINEVKNQLPKFLPKA